MRTLEKWNIFTNIALASSTFISWIIWGNRALQMHKVSVTSSRLPKAFSGFRIAQISDLHNTELDSGNKKLLQMLKKTQPDIIVITGDLIDSRRTNTDIALSFATQLTEIAPTYYVTGNHEIRVYNTYQNMERKINLAGIRTLHDEALFIERAGQTVQLIGMDDPNLYTDETLLEKSKSLFSRDLKFLKAENAYTILLSHRPELFDIYIANGIDLIFSGHAHGGQFRLPLIGGLYVPGQGLFPKYDGGLYQDGDTQMVVSRGLGNSRFPFRFNNRPELVIVELHTKNNYCKNHMFLDAFVKKHK